MADPRLKLFRATDFVRSTLMPGETRLALHPVWLAAGVGGWIALACNVALWRALARPSGAALGMALALGMAQGAAAAALLFALGWHRTRKVTALALLLAAALLATSLWQRGLEVGPPALAAGAALLLPPASAWAQGGVLLVLALLAVPPMAWAGSTQWRRLGSGEQWQLNLAGLGITLALAAVSLAVWYGLRLRLPQP